MMRLGSQIHQLEFWNILPAMLHGSHCFPELNMGGVIHVRISSFEFRLRPPFEPLPGSIRPAVFIRLFRKCRISNDPEQAASTGREQSRGTGVVWPEGCHPRGRDLIVANTAANINGATIKVSGDVAKVISGQIRPLKNGSM
jgi:hypothetical protein